MSRRKPRGCAVQGCTAKHKARGYCHPHYMKFRAYGDPLGTAPPNPGRKPRPHPHGKVCTFEGCTEPYAARGMCARHYTTAYQYVRECGTGWERATELARQLPAREFSA